MRAALHAERGVGGVVHRGEHEERGVGLGGEHLGHQVHAAQAGEAHIEQHGGERRPASSWRASSPLAAVSVS